MLGQDRQTFSHAHTSILIFASIFVLVLLMGTCPRILVLSACAVTGIFGQALLEGRGDTAQLSARVSVLSMLGLAACALLDRVGQVQS